MEELQIPTRLIEVEVFMSSGSRISGSLYVHQSPYHSGNPEDVIHLLNDDRHFLPLAVSEAPGEPFVVNKQHVVRVRLPLTVEDRFDRTRGGAATHRDCKLFLSDGTALEGSLSLETPTTSSRLVDKLNLAAAFVPVITDEGIDFVSKSRVVHAS